MRERIGVDGLIFAAMDRKIRLAVPVEIELSDHYAAGYRLFEDPG
jgi:hypothetical protein